MFSIATTVSFREFPSLPTQFGDQPPFVPFCAPANGFSNTLVRPSFAFTSVLVFFFSLRFGFCSVSCFLSPFFGFCFAYFLFSPPLLSYLFLSFGLYILVVPLSKHPFVVIGSYVEVWGNL